MKSEGRLRARSLILLRKMRSVTTVSMSVFVML